MNNFRPAIDVKNLCSRKLWELLNEQQCGITARNACERELLERRHYLPELQQLRRQRGPRPIHH